MSSRAFGILLFAVPALWAMTAPAALARDKPPAASDRGGREVIAVVGLPVLEIERAIRIQKPEPELPARLDRAVNEIVGTPDYRTIYVKWHDDPPPYWTARRVAWAMGGLVAGLLIVLAWSRYRLLVRLNRKVAASEEKFRDLIEGAVPGVLIHRDHKPLFVNRSYARIFGYADPEELLHQDSVLDHVVPRERARLEGYAAARLRGEGAPAVYEFEGVRKDGTSIWLEDRVRIVDWEGAPAIQRTVVDVTEKRRAEAGLMLRSSQQAVLAELGQRALVDRDLTALMNTAVTLVAKFLETDLCGLLELSPGGGKLLLRAGVGWKPGLVGKATVDAGKSSQAGFALSRKEPVVVADWHTETRFGTMPPLLRDHGVVSGVTVIIGDPERPLGTLSTHTKTPRLFSEDDVLFLKTVAIMLASAISRQRADDAIRAGEERLRGAIESLQEGFALYDADDRLVMINGVYRRISPMAREFLDRKARFEEILRANIEKGWVVEARGREEEFIRERLERHRDPKGTMVRQHADGAWYMIKETRTPEGGIAVTFTDISEFKQAEAALRESEKRFRAVTRSINDAIIAIDDENRIIQWNEGARRIFGYEECEMLGQPLSTLMPKRFRERHEAAIKHVKQTGESRLIGRTIELAGLHKDGSEFPAEISIGTWISGGKTYFSGVVRNVTDRKRAEDAARKSQALFRAVVDHSPTKIHIKDVEGRYTLINKEAARLFGVTDEQGRGKTSHDLFPKQEADVFVAHDRAVIESRKAIEHEETFTLDGEKFTYLTVKFPIFDGDRVAAVGAIGTDISKRKQEDRKLAELQAELAHVSRISTMGEMAAGLAHELNQPLTAITNYAKGTLRRLHAGGGDSVDLLPIMELVAEQALRAGDIIRKIRGFMNRSEPQKSRIDLRRTIDEVMSLLAGEINMSGIEVAVEVPDSLPPVTADSIQIQQVLLNLIRNAVAAMDGDGSNHHRLDIGAVANGTEDVEVYVRDNGPGIPPDVGERLFEPFFTTKTDGLGMGLSISRSIIAGHNGHIWFSSEPGKGASFHFTLPAGAGGKHDVA